MRSARAQVLEEGSAGTSRNGRALYLLAEAQRRTHDMAAAEATARKLIALDPKNLAGPRELAQIFEDQHEYQKIVGAARADRHGAVPRGGRRGDGGRAFRGLYFDLVSAYEQLKQYDKALAVLTQARTAVAAGSDGGRPAGAHAADRRQGRQRRSPRCRAPSKKFPDEPSVKIELASALERQKKFAEAENVFRQLISADPKNADALNSLGYMLAERGQRLDESVGFVRARARARSGQSRLSRQPGLGATTSRASSTWRNSRCGRPARSCRRCRSSRIISAICWHKRGDYQEAIDAWQRALDGDGDAITRSDMEDKIKSARQKLGKKK